MNFNVYCRHINNECVQGKVNLGAGSSRNMKKYAFRTWPFIHSIYSMFLFSSLKFSLKMCTVASVNNALLHTDISDHQLSSPALQVLER